jgi:pyruvate dehydrogenase E2 component (dihydrolipoamide acetyltransferase)
MAIEVVVPEVGEHGMDVTFVGWLREDGDEVSAGDDLFELDTDKSTMTVEAFADGVLTDLRVQAGDIVSPRQVVALLEPAGRQAPAMPRARLIARERGVDLATVTGTGRGGAITVADVEAAAPAPAAAGAHDDRAARVRAAVARSTTGAWQSIPHFHLGLEADATGALERLKPTVAICRALTEALLRRPECNLQWRDELPARRPGVDLGLLVDTPVGLLLPAIRAAHELDAEQLATAIGSAVARARGGTLGPDDRGARSASVSNLGMFAVDRFAGVIAAPDVLLLSAGRVRTAPRWIGGEWQPRRILPLTLSVDHRALDGADGARLLGEIEALLCDPEALA